MPRKCTELVLGLLLLISPALMGMTPTRAIKMTVWVCPGSTDALQPTGQGDIPGEHKSESWAERKVSLQSQGCFPVAIAYDAPNCFDKGAFFQSIREVEQHYPGHTWGGTECRK